MEKPAAEKQHAVNYWRFNRGMLMRLLSWNVINIGLGTCLLRDDSTVIRNIGQQAIGWGAINVLLVAFGITTSDRRRRNLEDPFEPQLMQKESKNLYRLLWINNRLNLVYMGFGAWLAFARGKDNEKLWGTGLGIIIQGALLFIHDSIHARRLKNDLKDRTS
ncbi:hypothetical protein HC928_18785 [bacterium]|nr:hypothetical protein [bacterium]